MAMGSTGTVNMTAKMLADIVQAVEEYRAKASGYAAELDSTVTGLIPSSFEGAAANGFKAFYDKTFTAEDGVNKGIENLLNTMKQMAEETSKAIPGSNGLDDQLGEGNNQ